MTHAVFVYGSLLRGLWNHGILARAQECGQAHFIGEIETKEAFAMVSFGAFPGLIDGGSKRERVTGEVWVVDDATLEQLDQLEGNGRFYTRQLRPVGAGDVMAWIYLLPKSQLGGRPRVRGGSWRAFVDADDPSPVEYDEDDESDDGAVFVEDEGDDIRDPFFVRGEG